MRLVLAYTCLNAPYLHFCPSSDYITEPKSTSSPNKQTHDFNYTHSLMSQHSQLSYTRSEPKQPSLPETKPLQGEVVFPKPTHAARVRSGPPGPTVALSQPCLAATICMSPSGSPHPPVPSFLLMQNPQLARGDYYFCAMRCN